MPSLTFTNQNIGGEGLNFDALITVSAIAEKNFPPNIPKPTPVSIKVQLDTGASHCIIRTGIPAKLGLTPIGATSINTPSCQNHPCYQYYMKLLIPYQGQFILIENVFTEAPLAGQKIDCLIGRDLLSQMTLIYIGYMNQFSISLM